MSNFLDNIKLIASELANMSPKTQLEIVKLCKNLCLNVKDYLVEFDETTLVNITTRLENLEDEMTTAEGNIQANANAIDTINDAIDLINDALDTINDTLINKLNIQTISLTGASGTLTEEELNKLLNKQNIIIEKDGLYFYKTGDVNGYLVFTKLSFDLTLLDGYDSVNKYVIDIYKSNGNWTYRAITLYTYTKQQIDELIAGAGGKKYLHHINVISNGNRFSFDIDLILDNNTPIQFMSGTSGLLSKIADGVKTAITGSYNDTVNNVERICLYGVFKTTQFWYYSRNTTDNTIGFNYHEGSDFNTYTVQDTITEF